MICYYVQEQKRYTLNYLIELLCQKDSDSKNKLDESAAVNIIRNLKSYGVLKTVKATDEEKELADLSDDETVISDVVIDDDKYFYVFTYVGILIVSGNVFYCYPKYIKTAEMPRKELQQIINVLRKYNNKEQVLQMYNSADGLSMFNLLTVMVALLQNYHENGLYGNKTYTYEFNGDGDILWDRTVNETFALIANDCPYYTDLYTVKSVTDEHEYIRRLHACILSKCSKDLHILGLTDIFSLEDVRLSDETLDDFGDNEYILYRLNREISVQFNSYKQHLLKVMYAYIYHGGNFYSEDSFSMFGTSKFNMLWEDICADILDNKLEVPIGDLTLPVALRDEYKQPVCNAKNLLTLIEKPLWVKCNPNGKDSKVRANDTLKPDTISFYQFDNCHYFIIFDAKYYVVKHTDKKITNQPGIESVTKQYLYELAYKDFVVKHGFDGVINCFVFPKEGSERLVENSGYVKLDMFDGFNLQPIQLLYLSAGVVYDYYLSNSKLELELLQLQPLKINKG